MGRRSEALTVIANEFFFISWIALMQRNGTFVRWGVLSAAAIVGAGFAPLPLPYHPLPQLQKTQTAEPPPNSQPAAPALSEQATPAPEPDRPLTPEEQKAAEARLQFDRVLVDAAVLLNEFEQYKRGRSKAAISMSAFRNLEIQLNAIADADPSNDQARDWAKKMQMAQFEILQPSVAAADVASRQLYADRMTENLKGQGINVAVLGSGARIVAFVSRQMTKQAGAKLLESGKILDQARRLQFEKIVFADGRRGWTYDINTGRYR
jgi:hypothetical protein